MSNQDKRQRASRIANPESPALVVQAREFLHGVEYAMTLVRESDSIGVSAALAKCPESYRRGQQDAIRAITTYLYPHNASVRLEQ